MRVLIAAGLSFILLAAAITWNGGLVLGRITLAFDQPRLALQFLDDPYWRGVALYRMEHFEEAAQEFRAAGQPAFFNRANALARAGRYSEAVAFYDAVLFYNPDDHDARTNRSLVNALIEKKGDVPLNGRFIRKDAKARNGPSQQNDNNLSADHTWAERVRNTSVFHSGQVVAANEEWLESLTDNPGRYLKLRVAAEHERRRRIGTAMPPGEDAW